MEIVRSILAGNVASKAFLGKTPKECQTVDLAFSDGIIHWTMIGHAPVAFQSSPTEPAPKFFDSFFSFYDFVNEINAICSDFVTASKSVEKLNQIAVMVKSAYPSMKFVLGCEIVVDIKEDFKSGSFVRYLQQVLVLDWQTISKAEKGLNYFLINTGLMLPTESILTLELESLSKRMVDFDYKLKEHWTPLLAQHVQPQDENTVLGAMKLGDRCRVPQLAAHLYLQEKEKREDPEYQKKIMLESRLAKYTAGKEVSGSGIF
jgi:hypothetical protein